MRGVGREQRARVVCGPAAASRREAGFTILEVTISLAIIAVGFFALVSSTGTSSRVLIQGKEKQTATDEANARLEDVHNIPYTQVAMTSAPAHSTDPANPNYYVDSGGTGFDSLHSGSYETLVIDATNGQVNPTASVTVGTISMTAYEFVTWVDDPSISGTQDYKRVTVDVVYSAADNPGRVHAVQASTLLTAGSVTIGGVGAAPTSGSPTPTASATPTPTPTPTGPCAGDTTAPTGSFTILSSTGATIGFTASGQATLSLAPSDPCMPIMVQVSNDNVTYGQWTTYDSTAPTTSWTLTSGDGSKSVWVHYKDGAGNQGTAGPQTITLDATLPTAPGTLTRTASCSGTNRTVNLSWGIATDANLLGYRIYKSINGAAYSLLKSTSTTATSDTDSKTLTSLNYKVVGYDKAGNEGPASNIISMAKNQCS